MPKKTTKPHKPEYPANRRLDRTTELIGDQMQPAWVFWDFMREFDERYQTEVLHNHWLITERRFVEVAIHAFRRLLRSHGADITIVRRSKRSPRHRSSVPVNFKIALNTDMAREYGRDLRLRHDVPAATSGILIEGSESARFVRAFRVAMKKYGFTFSEPQPLPRRERTLIQTIDTLLPIATKQRFNELRERREDESLSNAEHKEAIELWDLIEGHHVRRMQAAQKLAKLRGTPFLNALDEFGLMKPLHD